MEDPFFASHGLDRKKIRSWADVERMAAKAGKIDKKYENLANDIACTWQQHCYFDFSWVDQKLKAEVREYARRAVGASLIYGIRELQRLCGESNRAWWYRALWEENFNDMESKWMESKWDVLPKWFGGDDVQSVVAEAWNGAERWEKSVTQPTDYPDRSRAALLGELSEIRHALDECQRPDYGRPYSITSEYHLEWLHRKNQFDWLIDAGDDFVLTLNQNDPSYGLGLKTAIKKYQKALLQPAAPEVLITPQALAETQASTVTENGNGARSGKPRTRRTGNRSWKTEAALYRKARENGWKGTVGEFITQVLMGKENKKYSNPDRKKLKDALYKVN
jgi:hypothetical protein